MVCHWTAECNSNAHPDAVSDGGSITHADANDNADGLAIVHGITCSLEVTIADADIDPSAIVMSFAPNWLLTSDALSCLAEDLIRVSCSERFCVCAGDSDRGTLSGPRKSVDRAPRDSRADGDSARGLQLECVQNVSCHDITSALRSADRSSSLRHHHLVLRCVQGLVLRGAPRVGESSGCGHSSLHGQLIFDSGRRASSIRTVYDRHCSFRGPRSEAPTSWRAINGEHFRQRDFYQPRRRKSSCKVDPTED